MPKVLFITKNRVDGYGISFGLLNSAKFVSSFLNANGIDSEVVSVVDGNEIDKVVTKSDADFVFIEAIWATPDKICELLSLNRHRKRNWFIRIHSKIPFLAMEGIAMEWIDQYRNLSYSFPNLFIAPNSEELSCVLCKLLDDTKPIVYLPNLYYPEKYDFTDADLCYDYFLDEPGHIDVGCFGAVRPLKNHLLQAAASICFADDHDLSLRFHINGNRAEQRGDQVLKNLRNIFLASRRHMLIEHPWSDHKSFMRILGAMDIGLQVSLSETFNIVAADLVTMGVPVIGSHEIDWLPWFTKIKQPTICCQIYEKLDLVYHWNKFGIINKWQRHNLAVRNLESSFRWLNLLNNA